MGDKHILFDKDHELSETLDAMVIDVVGSYMIRGKRKSLDNLVGTTSWRESLKKLRTDFLERLAEPDAAETAAAEEPKKEKKRGFFGRLKDAAKATKDAILGKEASLGGMEPQMTSVSDKDLRTCFESVFGDSSSLTDESIRAICYNAVDRMTRE